VPPVSAERPVRQKWVEWAPGVPVLRGAEPELAAWRPEQEQAALQPLDQLAAFAEPAEPPVSQQQAVAPEWQGVSGEPL
jgi:hypothetical protein